MDIYMIGLDHNKADITVRELFSFVKSEKLQALQFLKQIEGIRGCILLSTCNRTELWLSVCDGFSEDLEAIFCGLKHLNDKEYKDYIRIREGMEAIKHLYYLTAGLKSQILGEDQILTQVKEALSFAREEYCTDQILEVLFRMAITAAKKCKTQVLIPKANTSSAQAAITMLQEQGCSFQNKKCLVIGNGMIGKLVATLLMELGACVTVTIRQYRSGVVDTPRNVKRLDYEKRYEVMGECDYVFSATSSPNLTILKERLEAAISNTKIYFLIDLAVPRDIDPEIDMLSQVARFDMDDLKQVQQSEDLKNALRDAEILMNQAIEEYVKWYETKDVVPRIQLIGEKAADDLLYRIHDVIRCKQIEEKDVENIEKKIGCSTAKVVNKLLFSLRDKIDADTLAECMVAMEKAYE